MEQADLAKYEACERDILVTHFADHPCFLLAGEISAQLQLLKKAIWFLKLILSKLVFIAVTRTVFKSYKLSVAVQAFQAYSSSFQSAAGSLKDHVWSLVPTPPVWSSAWELWCAARTLSAWFCSPDLWKLAQGGDQLQKFSARAFIFCIHKWLFQVQFLEWFH